MEDHEDTVVIEDSFNVIVEGLVDLKVEGGDSDFFRVGRLGNDLNQSLVDHHSFFYKIYIQKMFDN